VNGSSRVTARLLATAALCCGALVGIGCGDDNATTVTVPTISVEQDTEATTTQQGTTTEQDTTSTGDAPTQSPNGGTGSYDPGKPDSAKNDKPPAAGSPEAAFEQHCKQNPGACG
jgi:hypothetical protein